MHLIVEVDYVTYRITGKFGALAIDIGIGKK